MDENEHLVLRAEDSYFSKTVNQNPKRRTTWSRAADGTIKRKRDKIHDAGSVRNSLPG